MQEKYFDGLVVNHSGLTVEEAQSLAARAIADPELESVLVYRENQEPTNRHQRRKDAAEARRHGYGPNYRGEHK